MLQAFSFLVLMVPQIISKPSLSRGYLLSVDGNKKRKGASYLFWLLRSDHHCLGRDTRDPWDGWRFHPRCPEHGEIRGMILLSSPCLPREAW